MYKKIRGCIFTIGLASFFGGIFGMEQECALIQLMRKDIIPVLALNDFVVPVSKAYHALQKEACMPYDSIETMQHMIIKKVNKSIRNSLIKESVYLYKARTEKASNKGKKQSHLSYYRNIEIICSSPPEGMYEMDILMNINSFLYEVSHSLCRAQIYAKREDLREYVDTFLKGVINRILPNEQSICVEIRCPHKISDWIRIKNSFEFNQDADLLPENNVVVDNKSAIPMELLQAHSFVANESDYDALVDDMANHERLSHIIIVAISFFAGICVGGAIL